ncbi:DNA cytosine methyltransferase [Halalkalibacter akibai]|uniref:Cytosine-specific methyltransferase n=1 Tax=Halalkalibacter akibai (strain ATCC 43226 / DSM 21942 / CIP 109018 / JCM 9157 / 1139) TaxID=1236973 RepID=W4QYU8_HALA3|nr:DNA cytosine methyltransferase [Halalkalibacter akibai]GAE36459.1 DNA-cytosine methyltransferase [Halalkalibacter akibai JCM 9157]
MIFRKGELFSGPGGLALGATSASVLDASGEEFRITHEWSNDYDESACSTYRRNICGDIEDPSVIWGPVQELDIKSLSPIDALAFGFPCNDYSIVGEHKGMGGEYGPLYSYGVQVLKHHKPKFFIAENVGGLQSANEGKAFIQILKELSEAGPGYNLTPHLYKFEEYGVPQKRHRIIIVGIRKDQGVTFRVPAPTTPEKYVTSKEALENPPILEFAPNHEFTKHNAKTVEMLKHIPPGQNAWYEGIPEDLRLNVKGARMSQIYKRLHPDHPSYTVTGSGGGGTHVYHWDEPRALTNRERARLQTFPDEYIFEGKKEKVRQQIGMAVPPKAAKIIAEAILKTFAGVEYDYVAPKWIFEELVKQDKVLQPV